MLCSLQRLPLTRALKGFFLWFKSAVWWTSINHYHDFHAFAKRRFFPNFVPRVLSLLPVPAERRLGERTCERGWILSPFLEHSEENDGV